MNNDEADEILADAFGVNDSHAEIPPAKPLAKMPDEMREHLMKGAGKEVLSEFPKQPLSEEQAERVEEYNPTGNDDVPPALRPKVH